MDCFTENLVENLSSLKDKYISLGYEIDLGYYAEWAKLEMRKKDKADVLILEQILVGIDIDDARKKVWSHNPHFYEKGFEEYYFPVRL